MAGPGTRTRKRRTTKRTAPRAHAAPGDTRAAILAAARRLVARKGLGALTFEAVARELGLTKQAVIYWFPNKAALIRDLAVPAFAAEADAVAAAVADATDAADAIARAVTALVDFHLGDTARFRLMYLAPQTGPAPRGLVTAELLETEMHPTTARLYGAIEAALAADPKLRRDLDPRRAAVIVHTSALGLITLAALAEAADDPLAHRTADLTATLTEMLCGGVGGG